MPYLLPKTINYLSKQTCYGQILQKHSWVIFIASHLSVSMLTIFHANHFSYFCDNLSKFHGFYKIFGHRFPFLGQAFRQFSFWLTIQNFHMKRNPFKFFEIRSIVPFTASNFKKPFQDFRVKTVHFEIRNFLMRNPI
jgi:hypothetical protein